MLNNATYCLSVLFAFFSLRRKLPGLRPRAPGQGEADYIGTGTQGVSTISGTNETSIGIGNTIGSPEFNAATAVVRQRILQTEDVLIYSLMSLDSHIRVRFGGLVMAKSVKFLGKLATSLMDQETREGWWDELRTEIKGHARALCCTHIVGYSESCTIFGDVIVLMAIGTATTIKDPGHPILVAYFNAISNTDNDTGDLSKPEITTGISNFHEHGIEPWHLFPSQGNTAVPDSSPTFMTATTTSVPNVSVRSRRKISPCFSCHVPYNRNMAPFAFMRLVPCLTCRRKWVPEFILSTLEPPKALPIRGTGVFDLQCTPF